MFSRMNLSNSRREMSWELLFLTVKLRYKFWTLQSSKSTIHSPLWDVQRPDPQGNTAPSVYSCRRAFSLNWVKITNEARMSSRRPLLSATDLTPWYGIDCVAPSNSPLTPPPPAVAVASSLPRLIMNQHHQCTLYSFVLA